MKSRDLTETLSVGVAVVSLPAVTPHVVVDHGAEGVHTAAAGAGIPAAVVLAHPRHDAALGDQQQLAEAELLGAERRGHDQIEGTLQPPVDAQRHASAQALAYERAVDLGQAQLPGQPRVLHGAGPDPLRDLLIEMNPDDVTPRQALDILYRLREMMVREAVELG